MVVRLIENANNNKIKELLTKINLGINSMLYSYTKLYTNEEIILLKKITNIIDNELININNNVHNQKRISIILEYEEVLKPLSFRTWQKELAEGYSYISWFKDDFIKETKEIISATFSKNGEYSFCNSTYGIKYSVDIKGFLGACNKDAATLIEDKTKQSIYTIGKTNDDKVINSYNLATPIITPIEALDKTLNNYKSKHNEIILDSRYIKPISVVYTSDESINLVELISKKYNIPKEYYQDNNKTTQFIK